nr:TerB N-terminal domain-containing protein [Streptoalloteichus tenebrarius]
MSGQTSPPAWGPAPTPTRPARASVPAPTWVAPGTPVHLGHQVLPGGMFYLGQVPRDHLDTNLSGEVLDPTLPVDWARADLAGQHMDYWPAYHSIPPQSRAAYLLWLQGGRSAPNADIGYVILFFYGLERRALVDAQHDPVARAELPSILGEVDRLLGIYGANHSFHRYATAFRQVLHCLISQGQAPGTPPDPAAHDRWDPPFSLRAGIGVFARDGRPVPADWALSWALLHPEIQPRTPVSRCQEEFRQLFTARYHQRHGDGIVVRPLKRRLALSYRPASAALTNVELALDLPDVVTAAAPTRVLRTLVEACTDELDAYSRLLGRQPEAAGSLAAIALLPSELFHVDLPALRPVRDLVDGALSHGVQQATIDMAELVALWPPRTPGKFVKADAVGLAQLLERLGVGLEPDVRMGGSVRADGPGVLFRLTTDQPVTPSAEYVAAMTLLHLAAVVSAADDDVSDVERDHLVRHLESSLHLAPGERTRLQAHLAWLLASDLKLSGLKKRLAGLTPAQREHVAEFATTVAGVDGHISPDEVKTLRRIYTLLELDPETVYARLHAVAAGSTSAERPEPAREPVTVIPADARPTGYAIPSATESPEKGGLRLDTALVQAKMRESAAVAAMLAEVFEDEDAPEEPTGKAATAPGEPTISTLDSAHSTLVRRLAEKPTWTRAEFDAVCAAVGLLPEGALDVVNEAAIEATDEPLVEDDGDHLRIDTDILGELLA